MFETLSNELGLVLEFIPSAYLIVVVLGLLIGVLLKKNLYVPDKYIPLLLSLLVFVIFVLYSVKTLFTGTPIDFFDQIGRMLVWSILIACTSSGAHQYFFKQPKK